LSLDLNEEKEGVSLMSFGRDFQIRGPADRKPRKASVVLRSDEAQQGVRKKIEVIVLESKRAGEMTYK